MLRSHVRANSRPVTTMNVICSFIQFPINHQVASLGNRRLLWYRPPPISPPTSQSWEEMPYATCIQHASSRKIASLNPNWSGLSTRDAIKSLGVQVACSKSMPFCNGWYALCLLHMQLHTRTVVAFDQCNNSIKQLVKEQMQMES